MDGDFGGEGGKESGRLFAESKLSADVADCPFMAGKKLARLRI